MNIFADAALPKYEKSMNSFILCAKIYMLLAMSSLVRLHSLLLVCVCSLCACVQTNELVCTILTC